MGVHKRKKKGSSKSPSRASRVNAALGNLERPERLHPMMLRNDQDRQGGSHPMLLTRLPSKEKLSEAPPARNGTQRSAKVTQDGRASFKCQVASFLSQPKLRLKPKPLSISYRSLPPEESYRNAVKAYKSSGNAFESYGMVHSRKALTRRGFRPELSLQTPEEYALDWLQMSRTLFINKPTREQYLSGERKAFKGDIYSQSRQLTRAPFLPRYNLMDETFRTTSSKRTHAQVSRLEVMLGHVDLGPQILELIFEEGLKAAHQLALACKALWRLIAHFTRIWNSVSGEFQTGGRGGVLIVLNPEYTIDDFHNCRVNDPFGLDPSNPTAFAPKLMDWELDVLKSVFHRSVSLSSGRLSDTDSPEGAVWDVETLGGRLVEALKLVNDPKTIWRQNQFNFSPWPQLFEPQITMQATNLDTLLRFISEKRNTVRVLHLHKIPLLDQRILSIILRACPQLRMVGVYDCPMIHYGHVLCILDLIYNINRERNDKLPKIRAFDFHPSYQQGVPYQQDDYGATFGLTWNPENLEIVQRGFYAIILKALLKSRAMGLGLLFSKEHAFRWWMFKLPFPPLAIISFLDAVYRYLDLEGSNKVNLRMEAMFDLLKPVQLGLQKIDYMSETWYQTKMGMKHVYCSSCGYELLEEFFDRAQMLRAVRLRLCAGCRLQEILDNEKDHLKGEKKELLDILFCSSDDNDDTMATAEAPLDRPGLSLVHLYNGPRMDVNQVAPNARSSEIELPGLREYKLVPDSLQDLPTLTDLMSHDFSIRGR